MVLLKYGGGRRGLRFLLISLPLGKASQSLYPPVQFLGSTSGSTSLYMAVAQLTDREDRLFSITYPLPCEFLRKR